MNGELLIFFIILLLGLIACSFLGVKEGMENTNANPNANDNANSNSNSTESNMKLPASTDYDNYDHYNKTSSPTIFYGPNGATAKVIQTPNDNTIVITNKNGTTEIYYIDNNTSLNTTKSTYYGPNGSSAKLITDAMGKQSVQITTPSGSKIVYSGDNIYAFDSQDNTINQYDAANNTTGSDINEPTYQGLYGGQTTTFSGPAGNTYSTYDSSAYYNSLPQGIPRSQIPAGEEDLYILKSQVVPPVCPKCPDVIEKCNEDKFDVNKCPPCAPCARCPEPSFECKKVFTSKAFNPDYAPMPALADFSTFGM